VAIYDSTHAVAVGLGDAYHTFEFAEDTIIWNCLYEGESGMSNELSSVCFADENTIFTGGQEGEVYKIINNDFQNRITYQVDNIHSPFITTIVFPTQSIGYINNLYKTIDFGETWSFQPYPFNPVGTSSAMNDMFFLNENTGYAVGHHGLMLKTMNGGVFIKNELLSINVDIYPNPADDFVYITTDLPQHETFMFNILDINGKIVKHGVIDDKHKKISIANIKSGRYIIKLITSKGEINCKSFVKL